MEKYGDEGFIQLLRALQEEARDADIIKEDVPTKDGETDTVNGNSAQNSEEA